MSEDTINASSTPDGHVITDITVNVQIDHTFVGDLTIKLRGPDGSILALMARPQGDDADNNVGDDGATSALGDESNLASTAEFSFNDFHPFNPEAMGAGLADNQIVCSDDSVCDFFPNPDQALVNGGPSDFAFWNGQFPHGNWTLGVGDGQAADDGTFVRWNLTIVHQAGRSATYDSAPEAAIPDGGYDGSMESMFSDTIDAATIPPNNVVTSVQVQVTLDHTWVGDVTIKLRSPDGTILALVERPQGDDLTNNSGDVGDDSPNGDGSNLINEWPLAFSDAFTDDPEEMGADLNTNENVCENDGRCNLFPNPDQALLTDSVANFAAFDGESASGDWTLGIGDSAPTEAGHFVAWQIRIGHAQPLIDCQNAPFEDVPEDHQFCPQINWMKVSEISTGFGDGTYLPSAPVTRQAMSAFMARLAGAMTTPCFEPPYPDVPTSHQFCREIKWMGDSGIATGFGDGSYQPSAGVTRQAMSAFMARLADATLTACTVPPFTDVPISHPFCEEIKWMGETGVSTGFSNGSYGPSLPVTRQAMSAFMQRVSALIP